MRRTFRSLSTLLLCAGAVAACGDDDSPTQVQPLVPPTGLQVSANGAGRAIVNWNVVPGATGYLVQRAPGQGGDFATVGTPSAPPYEDASLAPETSYRYRVAAVREGETSAFSGSEALVTGSAARLTLTGDITSDRTLSSDTIYTLGSFVHVANGATLSIQAGTRIEGLPQSALFVLRGAKINAVGTADRPIVFTSARPAGQRQPGDWGGLIIVGDGIINRSPSVILEGTNTVSGNASGTNYAVDYAGGIDNADNSGRLEYVRIEFAGFGPAPDQELNSLTLAAVGSGTQIRYVQALSGLDDSFEWFGGAVDGKYLVSYEAGDDHFDASEGYVGRNQFLIALQSTVLPPRPGAGNASNDPQGIENDGCAGANCFNGQNSQPLTIPMFANFTLVGAGPNVVPASGGVGMMLRRGAGGFYVNGVVARWPNAAIALRDATSGERIATGDLQIKNLLLAENATTFETGNGRFTVDETTNAIETTASAAGVFTSLPTSPALGALDWTPSATSAARTGGLSTFAGAVAAKAGDFVTATTYRGAADPSGPKWWAGWTAYARN
jgi:hypothetical protein